MKNIKKYILGFLATLMLCITSVVEINNTQNDIVVNAEESSDMVYVGTPINPTGTYDKIYLNTKLSKDEVISIIEKLDFTYYGGNDNTDNYIYIGYYSSDYSSNIVIAKMLLKQNGVVADNPIYYIAKNGTSTLETIYWGNDDTIYDDWLDFENPISISNVGGLTELQGLSVGQQNGLLSTLISSTPFEYVSVTDTEWKGTAINPTGTYDKIYLNTFLSDDEVLQIIEQLDFVLFPYANIEDYTNYVYAPYILTDLSNSIVFLKSVNNNNNSVNYMIVSFDNNLQVDEYYWFYNVDFNQYGWQEFVNPIPFTTVGGTDNFDGASVGQQNDLISSLVSSTPFYRVLKDNPSKNQSMIAGLFGAITTGLTGIISPIIKGIENGFNDLFVEGNNGPTAINPTGTYDKLYINTDLSFDEINSMIDEIGIENNMTYVAYYSDNDGIISGFMIINSSGVYAVSAIVDGNMVGIISVNHGTTITQEWLDFENPLSVNLSNGVLENPSVQGQLVGDKNDLIKDFISATPFESNQTLTPLGIFLIGMFGLAIGFGLIWLIISIFKHRK